MVSISLVFRGNLKLEEKTNQSSQLIGIERCNVIEKAQLRGNRGGRARSCYTVRGNKKHKGGNANNKRKELGVVNDSEWTKVREGVSTWALNIGVGVGVMVLCRTEAGVSFFLR